MDKHYKNIYEPVKNSVPFVWGNTEAVSRKHTHTHTHKHTHTNTHTHTHTHSEIIRNNIIILKTSAIFKNEPLQLRYLPCAIFMCKTSSELLT